MRFFSGHPPWQRAALPLPLVTAIAILATASAAMAAAGPTASGIEGERMHVPRGARDVVRDPAASGDRALVLRTTARARARLRLTTRSRVEVVARSKACHGIPRLRVMLDGKTAILRRAATARFTRLSSRRIMPAGRHAVAISLADPLRARGCRRAVEIDAVRLVRVGAAVAPRPPAAPAPGAAPAPSTGGIWRPGPHTTWQWQLTTPVDLSVSAGMFDIDLFDNGADVVSALHASGRRAVCYLSAGTYEPNRPDSGTFPADVLGDTVAGWPNERWLDIRRLDVLGPIMEKRLDLCHAKGFDGVEPDNVDGYSNGSGFALTAADQLAYNRFLVQAAHARGLSIGLKNDLGQAAELQPDYDWALNEECFQTGECDLLRPFAAAGKAVFNVEYALDTSAFCPQAQALGFMAMRKSLSLDASRTPCW
jgi:Glycoside-hydrolase family GH114